MEDINDQPEGHLDQSIDGLSSSIKKRLSLVDGIEKDQQQQSLPLRKRQLSNVSVCSLLDIETDHEVIESLELLLNSVVKIFCNSIPCRFHSPWQVRSQVANFSSGFIIKDRWILSTAHAVSNRSTIRIRKHGDTTKYPGRVLHIAHECDLVILTVDNDQFWNNVEPLTLSDKIPRLQESVTVFGYPVGGDNLSVTKGVVSRVCMSNYSHSLEYLLNIQIDAAINSGNSGGPAIQGKQVVGMSFESISDAQSIGYIIPVLVIKHVLNDIELHGIYTAFPTVVFGCQTMENLSYRKYLKLNDDQHGVLVTSVEPACVFTKVLKKEDVITAIDDKPIADDGTIYFRRGERLSFVHLLKLKFVGETATFRIIRQGQEITLTSSLDKTPALVPWHSHDKCPEYLIYAGIVFTVLTRFFLYEWSKDVWDEKAPKHLVSLACNGALQELTQQIVIINQILADDVNYGIDSDVKYAVLKIVNGVEINNIKHLAELIDEISNKKDDAFIRFEMETNEIIVIECKEAKQSEERILTQNSIAHARGENLR
ncbi:unnamed protein product [Adineta steineri]|uniref:Protease Do-like PDZ domain-containing protein n=1 Tax=Adineta steineri TaxID=433720 RepID=A0A819K345_9BILA|nr:unnamed protein product [Adineta steineri]CAF3943683.1 unnamed protein product [Adineta steineri]